MTGPGAGFYVHRDADHLELRREGESGGVWIRRAELSRRSGGAAELLHACGAAPGLTVLDVMAGWGVDALVLAARGCRVTLVERQPLLVALQRDLLRRSGLTGVECRQGDGFEALGEGKSYDVVYLDPMFDSRGKTALPGKRMQWLAELASPDGRPLAQWLGAALPRARRRVVVKRRRTDPATASPDWQIRGSSVRYDVYRGTSQSSCSTA